MVVIDQLIKVASEGYCDLQQFRAEIPRTLIVGFDTTELGIYNESNRPDYSKDTLAALNLPIEEDGWIESTFCVTLQLGMDARMFSVKNMPVVFASTSCIAGPHPID